MPTQNASVTWIEEYRQADGVSVIVAWAGDKPAALTRTNEIAKRRIFEDQFPNAKQFLIAADSKQPPSLTPAPSDNLEGRLNRSAAQWYTQEINYQKVASKVLEFYPAGTFNGCVAYMSTMLRFIGLAVPIAIDPDGYNISLVTKPFSAWLVAHNFKRIKQLSDLQEGDICFSVDGFNDLGFPMHTYVFLGWENQGTGYAWVIDNQGQKHQRNMLPGGAKDPFEYALRSPV